MTTFTLDAQQFLDAAERLRLSFLDLNGVHHKRLARARNLEERVENRPFLLSLVNSHIASTQSSMEYCSKAYKRVIELASLCRSMPCEVKTVSISTDDANLLIKHTEWMETFYFYQPELVRR